MNARGRSGFTAKVVAFIIAAVAVVLIFGSWWMGRNAQMATEEAVRSVSMFYLDELAGRREQVVETNLANSVSNMEAALGLLNEEDLSDMEHLQAFQAKMKQLYSLEKFAFVDETGLIYTSLGTQDNIQEYGFDYQSISEPEVSVKDVHSEDKKVVIAMPLDGIPFMGHELRVCFMEIDMKNLIEGLSLQSDSSEATFCNLYTTDGVPLTNMVLGGLASEDNLLDALNYAQFEPGSSRDAIVSDFQAGNSGIASFTYNDIQETLAYAPVPGTDWMLTYLIRESVISDQISDISLQLTTSSVMQTLFTALVMLVAAGFVIVQTRRSARYAVEREAIETEARVKQEEMEQRLALQEQLLEQEKQRAQQDKMITALASDYRSVYYVDLDDDVGICYQANDALEGAPAVGMRFPFFDSFVQYCDKYVAEEYRAGFLDFIDAAAIRRGLADQTVISYRYLIEKDGVESYEMMRIAGVRHAKDREDGIVHAAGIGFVNVDDETREQMARSRALSDALAVAEDASRAKTAFLSNMSHEIRTPMNAIIGLGNIALTDTTLSEQTRGRIESIDSSARHLLGIINDILDVSRIESGHMTIRNEAFSLTKLIDQVDAIVSSQCSGKGLDYHCEVKEPVGDGYLGDDTKLRQVLVNVLGNAVKFTPKGGSVSLIVERTAWFAGNSTLRFTMSDTGIGMSEDYLPKIFDTFSQEEPTASNKYGSTGLGLAITKSIVEMMNGTIEVESEKGAGTTFVVTVTLADADDAAVSAAGELDAVADGRASIDLAGRRVLLAEDVDINADIMVQLLDMREITAERAVNGKVAVDMFAAHEPGYYDAVLMDMRMPEMDGLEATRTIRSMDRDDAKTVPIIALTANAFEEDVQKSLQAGLNAHLSKPVDPDILFSTLEGFICQ